MTDKIKVVGKGYTVKATSWEEGSYDDISGTITVPTKELADGLLSLTELFKDGGLLGNIYEEEYISNSVKAKLNLLFTTKYKPVIDYFTKIQQGCSDVVKAKSFDCVIGNGYTFALFEVYIVDPLRLYSREWAMYRICNKCTVTYSEKDFYITKYKEIKYGTQQ